MIRGKSSLEKTNKKGVSNLIQKVGSSRKVELREGKTGQKHLGNESTAILDGLRGKYKTCRCNKVRPKAIPAVQEVGG